MDSNTVKLDESWKQLLIQEFSKDYFVKLKQFLLNEKQNRQTIYPPGNKIFAAFDYTPFDKVKVVILGQDPYHGTGQANGLCFSVAPGIKQPPSLQNIFKELENDLGISPPVSGDLTPWARQGVLLLNATLTVKANQAGSHQNQGWEVFTDKVIQLLSDHKEHLVFILWGKYAQGKETFIDKQKHLIIKSAHPSPFSAYSGFFGSKPFSKTNSYLISKGISPVNFAL
ncbi:MAG: uracil-DNA glycosylase [Bacteroidia bacterium]|nr:uracil-DNA glycosylase [Bacteroidia bacterium]